MRPASNDLLLKAARSIAAAPRLLDGGHAEFAASRAYCAMFYVAQALLGERGLRFRKHGGVHAAFGEHFVKTGAFERKCHRWLLEAFHKRIAADYGVRAEITTEESADLVARAAAFLQAGREFLEQPSLG